MDAPSILPILKKIPLFADLTEEEHKEIIKNIVLNYFPVGHVFFREGDADGSMYIIKHGIIKITRKDPTSGEGAEKEIAVLTDNDFFGEMALVLNETRNATATAAADCEVFELRKEDFVKLMETSPAMANKVSTEFLSREKQNKPARKF